CQLEGRNVGLIALAHNLASAPATTTGSALVRLMSGATLGAVVSAANLLHAPLAGGTWYNDHSSLLSLPRVQALGLEFASFAGDPSFVNPAAMDYRLAPNSIARGAGLEMHVAWDDLLGNIRPLTGRQTIGALE